MLQQFSCTVCLVGVLIAMCREILYLWFSFTSIGKLKVEAFILSLAVCLVDNLFGDVFGWDVEAYYRQK